MIIQSDILRWCEEYDGEPFHAALLDPPYHLTDQRDPRRGYPAREGDDWTNGGRLRAQGGRGFMNARWDGGDIAFRPETWAAIARHLHPGAFGMAFASSRGWHRMAVAIEDAGLIIHPSIFLYSYGSGFPKATRVPDERFSGHRYGLQAMKPAAEPIIVFQKPYQGRPIDCITRTGAGALNIEGGRIRTNDDLSRVLTEPKGWKNQSVLNGSVNDDWKGGRWPANLLLNHTASCRVVGTQRVKREGGATGVARRETSGYQGGFGDRAVFDHADADGYETVTAWECAEGCPAAALDAQSGERPGATSNSAPATDQGFTRGAGGLPLRPGYGDTGGASRFFHQSDWAYEIEERIAAADPVRYCAKAGRTEREMGLDPDMIKLLSDLYGGEEDSFEEDTIDDGREIPIDNPYQRGETSRRNIHPTVKPVSLSYYLAKLLLPPVEYAPRRLLIPFAGVASEYLGALFAGWEEIIGVELEAQHCRIAEARIRWWQTMKRQTHSSDPGAILKTYGTMGKTKPSSPERWPAGSLFESLEVE